MNVASAVLSALYAGHVEEAKTLLRPATATLHELAALGCLPECVRLLGKDAFAANALSADGWTPLHLAAYFGHVEVAIALLRHGAQVKTLAASEQGNTALHACLAGTFQRSLFLVLLGAGASVEMEDVHGVSPMHLAASRGNRDAIALLVELGANPGAKLPDGRAAADLARERGFAEVADWIAGMSAVAGATL